MVFQCTALLRKSLNGLNKELGKGMYVSKLNPVICSTMILL